MPTSVYLKTEPDMPRPLDSEFYLMTGSGNFFCRNHPFFKTDVPTQRHPRALAEHRPRCELHYPKLRQSALEFIVGFFHKIYEMYHSEAIVLLVWDLNKERYRLFVPEQEVTIWETSSGYRSPMDVTYKTPTSLPPGQLIVADIHSHGDLDAYSSWQDKKDELHRDGVHAVCGRIHRDVPEFHVEISVDGFRFKMNFDQFFEGFDKRRTWVPKAWIEKVKPIIQKSTWGWSYSSNNNSYGDSKWDDDYGNKKKKKKKNKKTKRFDA